MAVGPAVSFLAAPVLHLGQRVGNVYLAEKEAGEEFTGEDEETLRNYLKTGINMQ